MRGGKARFVKVEDVETLELPWGRLNWLSEPRVTGSDVLTTGIVLLERGKGHERHNHPGCEEIVYVLEGRGEQFIEHADGRLESRLVGEGDLVHIPADYYHGITNTGSGALKLLVVYQKAGPEAYLRSLPECIVHAPANLP